MRFKQHYHHPANNKISAVDINVFFEEARDPNGSTPYVKSTLVAAIDNVHYVAMDVDKLIYQLLDTKRTSSPKGLVQTYLNSPYNLGNELFVGSTEGFNVGDPIAVMPYYNVEAEYSLISNKTNTSLILQNSFKKTYFKGAIVQSLKSREWDYPLPDGAVGAAAYVQRPGSIRFNARSKNGEIQILIQEQINLGTTICYDLYVREQPFKYIESHWIPDVEDVPLKITELTASTYGGDVDAGGGKLQVGSKYYLAIITKDNYGRTNVNESSAVVEPITIV